MCTLCVLLKWGAAVPAVVCNRLTALGAGIEKKLDACANEFMD
jgi:hypothetical protein